MGRSYANFNKGTRQRLMYLEDPFRSVNQLHAASNFPGCSWTVNNHLRAGNLRSRRAVRKFDLTEEHAVDRLAFVTSIDEGFDWGWVIFSDETIVSTDYNGSARVYRESAADMILVVWTEVSQALLSWNAGTGSLVINADLRPEWYVDIQTDFGIHDVSYRPRTSSRRKNYISAG